MIDDKPKSAILLHKKCHFTAKRVHKVCQKALSLLNIPTFIFYSSIAKPSFAFLDLRSKKVGDGKNLKRNTQAKIKYVDDGTF